MNKVRTESALVVASFGNRGRLDTGDGVTRPYVLKGRRLRAVCGDQVEYEHQTQGDELVVTAVAPRRNQLERPDSRGRSELLAANIDRMLVVLASEPEPDFYIADRYLCAAELMNAAAAIVWNKADLHADEPPPLDNYRGLGYPVVVTSAESGVGMDELTSHLQDGISILAGQSGVGKSSLLNRLLPEAEAATGEVSDISREGRHTTTASIMYQLDAGGRVIDTPGVREFAPVIHDLRSVQSGFREISRASADCRFADCGHLREPDCAVQRQVSEGIISSRRFESYRRLCNTVAKQKAPGS